MYRNINILDETPGVYRALEGIGDIIINNAQIIDREDVRQMDESACGDDVARARPDATRPVCAADVSDPALYGDGLQRIMVAPISGIVGPGEGTAASRF